MGKEALSTDLILLLRCRAAKKAGSPSQFSHLEKPPQRSSYAKQHTHPLTPFQALVRRTDDCREGRRTPLPVTAETLGLVLDVWPGAEPALQVP